ncbi:SsgA family sporulation/cell division regulator [Kitasatospora camelliae]|uniref:SsgA family sporulation/cell division regulator n=1 Tax=Kitasatospora camelliae TaxID=3156397 RepID=A0AAU8JXG1_9ACTN
MSTSVVVEQAVRARLVLGTRRSAALRVTLRYRLDDPLAVWLLFPAEYALEGEPDGGAGTGPVEEVPWVFARELLAAGLRGPAGAGDVHLSPGAEWTLVELRAPEGTALVRFRTEDLRRFLARTLDALPEGREFDHLDPDRALAALLGS